MKIIDAHVHIGQPNVFFAPETTPETLLQRMDQLNVSVAVCTDHLSITIGCATTLPGLRDVYERSGGRICYQAVFHPGHGEANLRAMREALDWPGFVGIKIHPSFHRTPAEDAAYAPVWRFAAEHGLPILSHTWSASDYNPVQQFSLPNRFEQYIREFPGVQFVLGHVGGRGREQADAMRLAAAYPNAYTDIAGDVFCHRLIEKLVARVPAEKILYGSDYPWLDLRANYSRVLLAEIDDAAKARILGENALAVYARIGDGR